MSDKTILLTFDLEEFDLPREFNQKILDDEMFKISKEGVFSILNLLSEHNIKSTFFTTANFAKNNKEIVREVYNTGHEIACHGYYHSDSYINDLSKIPLAKKELEKIIGNKIYGFRAPRFEIKNISKLFEYGFRYDSSIHPTIAPGRYSNLSQKRKIHKIDDITEIPLSTLPLFPFLRAPFNWYMFRHFPILYGKLFAGINFYFSNYLMMIFHPWEFVDLGGYNIPKPFKKNSGRYLYKKLDEYVRFCKKNNYKFETIKNYLDYNNL